MVLDDLSKLVNVGGPQVSPDGKWIAYTTSHVDVAEDKNLSELWMVSWDGTQDIQLTYGPEGVGVTALIRTGDEPIAVPGEIIATLREREQAGAFDRTTARQLLRVGELVRVTAGAFEDIVGRLIELRDEDRVVVLLELLGRSVRAELGAAAVEAV